MSSIHKLFILGLLISFTLLYSVYTRRSIEQALSSSKNVTVLKKLPKGSFQSVDQGSSVNIYDEISASQIIAVHFWGTWCAPCEEELPNIFKMLKRFPENKILFVAIAINDTVADIKKFLKKKYKSKDIPKNIKFYLDDKNIALSGFGTLKVPETFIFDGINKQLLRKFIGPQSWNSTFYYDYFKEISNTLQ